MNLLLGNRRLIFLFPLFGSSWELKTLSGKRESKPHISISCVDAALASHEVRVENSTFPYPRLGSPRFVRSVHTDDTVSEWF